MTATKKRYATITMLLLVVAIGLLLFSTIGSARAALNIQSGVISSEIAYKQIGISVGDPKGAMVTAKNLIPGKSYDVSVSVSNPGAGKNIDEYVRVTVYKYWVDKDSKKNDPDTGKAMELDPKMIILDPGSGWTEDTSLQTAERAVYYRTSPVKAGSSVSILKSLQIDSKIASVDPKDPETKNNVTYTNEGGVITTTYKYDGAEVHLEIVADGVQTHNASDAMLSAWGKSYVG